MSLPGIDQLESTPEILRLLMEGLSEEDTNWKAGPDRFSIAETLEHLSHVEGHCFRTRVERMVNEDNPTIESYDTDAYVAAGQYSGRSAEDSFDHFEEQRETNIEALRDLPPAAGERRAVHKKVGPITLAQMLNEWALHDLGHIRQIAELIRARKYLAGAAPLAAFYQLKP